MSSHKEKIKNSMPRHVAFIMDGNGRWAKSRNIPKLKGYREGVKAAQEVIKFSIEKKIEYLTLYAFSIENWGRSEKEVSDLMSLLRYYFLEEIENFYKENIYIKIIGNKHLLPEDIQNKILEIEDKTKDHDGLFLNIAISYGSRQEILGALKKMLSDSKKGTLKDSEIEIDLLSDYVKGYDYPDPDLLIRTGGEKRLSNFLLWQIAYTELYFTDILWPDFKKEDFEEAILEFKLRDRRYGTA